MKIAIVVDKIGWVQYARAKILARLLPANISIFTIKDKFKTSIFDRIYYSNINMLSKNKIEHDFILSSITSHKTVGNTNNILRELKRCCKCSVNSKILYDIVHKYADVCYIPNGVDSVFFNFKEKQTYNKPTIGWVGNKDRATKNYHIVNSIIKGKKNVTMKVVATEKRSGAIYDKYQMKKFYHTLDFFLVCSTTEGTPNPALEAASCGVPIIATRVGNMPELISDNINGFFVKDNYNSISEKIDCLVNVGNYEYALMRKKIRKEIESDWDWSKRVLLYKEFFEI